MRPKFIKAVDLLKNIPQESLHIHTTYTDGECSISEVIGQAKKKGLKRIAITEHIDKNSDWFDRFSTEAMTLRRNHKDIEVFYGIEPRVINYEGNLNATDDVIKKSEIVIGVVHSYPKEIRRFETEKYRMGELDASKALELEYNACIGLLSNTRIDVLGHLGATYYTHFQKPPYDFYVDIIRKISLTNIAIEINPFYLDDITEFLNICMRFNPYVSIGDNAHKLSEIGSGYDVIRRSIDEL